MDRHFEVEWDSNKFINLKEGAKIIRFEIKDYMVEISGTAISAINGKGCEGKSLVISSLDFKMNMPLDMLEHVVKKLKDTQEIQE
jgi:hypothetical protein